jgi:5-methylcytosine-specific restriction endonuclease McrA
VIHRKSYIRLGSIPKSRDQSGSLICLNCGKKLVGRMTKYCSNKCSWDWLCKHSHQHLRTKLIQERKNLCCACNQTQDSSNLILDHILPIAVGGAEFDVNNLQLLCKSCNKTKTRNDMKIIARQRLRERTVRSGQKLLTQ